MSATRVDSPCVLELRRMQPSPPFPAPAAGAAAAAAVPKPRACRQLFAVDHAETDCFLSEQLAEMNRQQRRETGFDADRCRPLSPAPGEPDVGSSRYTDWEAVPASEVPAFYRETDSRRRPAPHHLPPRLPTHLNRRPTGSISGGYTDRLGADDCPVLSRCAGNFRPVVSNRSGTSALSTSSSPAPPSRPSSLPTSTSDVHPTRASSTSSVPPSAAVQRQAKETVTVELPAKRPRSNDARDTTTQSTITNFFQQRKMSGISPTRPAKRHCPSDAGESLTGPVEGQS